MTESITTVLQIIHLETVFINTTIPSSTRVRQIPHNYLSISEKRKGIEKPIMHWSVIDHAKSYQNWSKRCNLCLTEKYYISTSPVNLINKRTELVSKCHHENNFYLVNYKAKLKSQLVAMTTCQLYQE